MSVPDPVSESLSQRQLRNESGRVLRAVSEGQSFVLTNRGVAVGRLIPIDAPAPTPPIVRPARRVGGWAALGISRKHPSQPLEEILEDLREDRM